MEMSHSMHAMYYSTYIVGIPVRQRANTSRYPADIEESNLIRTL